jgi:hypothetical protein
MSPIENVQSLEPLAVEITKEFISACGAVGHLPWEEEVARFYRHILSCMVVRRSVESGVDLTS